jgi:hypothetical protein
MPNSEGCGHQHSSKVKAWNCAGLIAQQRKTLAWIEVIRIRANGSEHRMGKITQFKTCPECNGLTFIYDDGSTRGHFEDCPTLTTLEGITVG